MSYYKAKAYKTAYDLVTKQFVAIRLWCYIGDDIQFECWGENGSKLSERRGHCDLTDFCL